MRRWAAIMLALNAQTLLAQGVGSGTRVDLTAKLNLNDGATGQFAQLFIPVYFVTSGDSNFTLVFHLHSASRAAENALYRARVNAILFNIHLGALSSPYRNYFASVTNFHRILDTVKSVLRENGTSNPHIARLIITSFSAGYAGVREILKSASDYERINALILADGLHANSDSSTMRIQMQDFVRFGLDARERRKVFILSHSNIQTSGYENTTSTADYLVREIGATRRSVSIDDEIGTQYSRCDSGYFLLKGYRGNTANDHLRHLHGMHVLLGQATGFLDSATISSYKTRTLQHLR